MGPPLKPGALPERKLLLVLVNIITHFPATRQTAFQQSRNNSAVFLISGAGEAPSISYDNGESRYWHSLQAYSAMYRSTACFD